MTEPLVCQLAKRFVASHIRLTWKMINYAEVSVIIKMVVRDGFSVRVER